MEVFDAIVKVFMNTYKVIYITAKVLSFKKFCASYVYYAVP